MPHCHDLKGGEEHYAERIDGPCRATPVAAGGKVYCFGKNGVTAVVKGGAEFEVVASNKRWAAEKPMADAAKPAEGGGGGGGEYGDPTRYGVGWGGGGGRRVPGPHRHQPRPHRQVTTQAARAGRLTRSTSTSRSA